MPLRRVKCWVPVCGKHNIEVDNGEMVPHFETREEFREYIQDQMIMPSDTQEQAIRELCDRCRAEVRAARAKTIPDSSHKEAT